LCSLYGKIADVLLIEDLVRKLAKEMSNAMSLRLGVNLARSERAARTEPMSTARADLQKCQALASVTH